MTAFLARLVLVVGLILSSAGVRAEAPKEKSQALASLVQEAEHYVYAKEVPNRFERVEKILNEIGSLDPTFPYYHWARARLAFFLKQRIYTRQEVEDKKNIEKEKLAFAEECHHHIRNCLELDPNVAECHMMKGVCYAMQASTWGAGFKSLGICKPMDQAFKKAMTLPSDFSHRREYTTKQLSQILRAILHRVMPNSWWFRLLSGVRGNKKRAYEWISEAVTGSLLKEPVVLTEFAATALCYGIKEKNEDALKEGKILLLDGVRIPTYEPLDEFDKRNMLLLLQKPKEACNYRRERFENLSDDAISSRIEREKSE